MLRETREEDGVLGEGLLSNLGLLGFSLSGGNRRLMEEKTGAELRI